jgi:hypothetical protein
MKNKFEILGLIITGFALLTQFYLIIENRQASITETIIRFFSFFTVLTNTLVALFFITIIFKLKQGPFKILSNQTALTAITTFILIVGLVYQFALRGIWQPTGMQYLIDELLHSIMPLYVLIYWLFTLDKSALELKPVFTWLLYPMFYLLLVFTRGYFSGFYPYPFLNIPEIGLINTLQNMLIIIGVTAILFSIMLFIGKIIISKRTVSIHQEEN